MPPPDRCAVLPAMVEPLMVIEPALRMPPPVLPATRLSVTVTQPKLLSMPPPKDVDTLSTIRLSVTVSIATLPMPSPKRGLEFPAMVERLTVFVRRLLTPPVYVAVFPETRQSLRVIVPLALSMPPTDPPIDPPGLAWLSAT